MQSNCGQGMKNELTMDQWNRSGRKVAEQLKVHGSCNGPCFVAKKS